MKHEKRIKSILKAINTAQSKLTKAQVLIEEASNHMETAFLLHDEKLVDAVEEYKKYEKPDHLLEVSPRMRKRD